MKSVDAALLTATIVAISLLAAMYSRKPPSAKPDGAAAVSSYRDPLGLVARVSDAQGGLER